LARSMTGYGRGDSSSDLFRVVAEARSVNHRYLEIVPRMPRALLALEDRVRRSIAERVVRGRLDVTIAVEFLGQSPKTVKVDSTLGVEYFRALTELKDLLGIPGQVVISDVVSLPEVLTVEEKTIDPEQVWPLVSSSVLACMDALVDMRGREGERLASDLSKRILSIISTVDRVEPRSPAVVQEYRERLEKRLSEIVPRAVMDEPRLSLEVALLAERSSITEEIVRTRGHLAQIQETLRTEEACGRKLDFLLQEVNREVNTISSKSSDLSIAEAAVMIKSELEKIREQVQNLE